MGKWFVSVVLIAGLVGFFLYFRWSSSIKQPLGFSHSQHVKAGPSCGNCHPPDSIDSLPAIASCKSCHTDLTLPERVSWTRVYRVAPDIIFKHDKHQKTECAFCHQELVAAQRWIHEKRFPMNFCMDCHAKQNARNDCKACHRNM